MVPLKLLMTSAYQNHLWRLDYRRDCFRFGSRHGDDRVIVPMHHLCGWSAHPSLDFEYGSDRNRLENINCKDLGRIKEDDKNRASKRNRLTNRTDCSQQKKSKRLTISIEGRLFVRVWFLQVIEIVPWTPVDNNHGENNEGNTSCPGQTGDHN